MLNSAKKALKFALDLDVGQAEAFSSSASSTSIKVYKQEVEDLLSSTGSGVGIRVFKDHSVGYAYTSDLSEKSLARAAREAVDNAAVTAADDFVGLPEPAEDYPEMNIHSAGMAEMPLAEKIEIAMTAEQAALDHDPRISQVEQASYNEAEGTIAIANSSGLAREYRETSCYAFTMAIALQEGQMQTGISFTTGREPGQLDSSFCGHEAAARAVALLGATQCESMTCPVVMDPFVTASLVGVIGSALTGESVQKQRSLFAGLAGQQVAGGVFSMVDDGIHPDGLASAPFDGEGVPMRETDIIKNGILQGFLYDSYSGRKDGRQSTGNGIRGSYRSLPHVGATNLRIIGGTQSQEQIISSVEKGFYVTEVSGIHSGANAISGDFSVGAAGHLIKSGKISTPVREVTVAGNILSILKGVEVVGSDNRWIPFAGSIHAPTLMIGEMTVSGK